MGTPKPAHPVKLFVGLLTSMPGLVAEAEEQLCREYGDIDLRGGPFPFDLTDYYRKEMGDPIERHFFAFATLIRPDALAAVKERTNQLESDLVPSHSTVPRPVNLDPGYLAEAKVVLASTKDFYHRIYLGRGIYGEVTLRYRKGMWQSWPWTFPDFASRRYDPYFTSLRERYRAQLQGLQWE